MFFKIFYCLYYYSCPNFFPSSLHSTQPAPHFHSQSPHCSPCPWALHICALTISSPSFNQSLPPPTPSTAGDFNTIKQVLSVAWFPKVGLSISSTQALAKRRAIAPRDWGKYESRGTRLPLLIGALRRGHHTVCFMIIWDSGAALLKLETMTVHYKAEKEPGFLLAIPISLSCMQETQSFLESQ